MRMSRSRISAGADVKELHAQQLAQRGLKARSPPPVPPMPPVPSAGDESHYSESSATSPSVTVTEEPAATSDPPAVPPPPPIVVSANVSSLPDYSKIPPPPPLKTPSPQPQVVAPVSVPADGRPTFKEPPPEDDDLPPRPHFRELSPERSHSPPLYNPHGPEADSDERADSPSLPMPSFVDPPPEPQSPPVVSSRSGFSRPTSPRSGSGSSRDASPTKVSISRRSSLTPTTAPGGARGPRPVNRGPRTSTGSVSSLVSNFNNRNPTPAGAGAARPSSPGGLGRSPSRPTSTHVKRSSASRASMFERRTMASDAEDEVVQ